jgi:hypothetical protein
MIHDYRVTLEECNCPDFQERKLPCKHIYCLAAITSISMPITYEIYSAQKNSLSAGIEISIQDGVPEVKIKE